MPKTSLVVAGFLLALSCSAFAEPEVLGYFEAKPDLGGARNRFCVESGDNGNLSISIATAYCPSKECMNARLDGFRFQAPLKSDQLTYIKKPGCTVRIKFLMGEPGSGERRAVVAMSIPIFMRKVGTSLFQAPQIEVAADLSRHNRPLHPIAYGVG